MRHKTCNSHTMQESRYDQSSFEVVLVQHKMPRELTSRIQDVMAILTNCSNRPSQDCPAKVAKANEHFTILNFSESCPWLQDHAHSSFLSVSKHVSCLQVSNVVLCLMSSSNPHSHIDQNLNKIQTAICQDSPTETPWSFRLRKTYNLAHAHAPLEKDKVSSLSVLHFLGAMS